MGTDYSQLDLGERIEVFRLNLGLNRGKDHVMVFRRFPLIGFTLVIMLQAPLTPNAAVISDDTIVGTITNDFEALPIGDVAEFISQVGATYGEHFAGQTLIVVGGFDTLSGSPTNPLTLVANPIPADNIGLCSSPCLSGSIVGYGSSLGLIGEGAFSILLAQDTDVFGFEVVGGIDDGGALTAQFFARDGALLSQIILVEIADGFFGFRSTTGFSIAGISLTNTDVQGLGYDNFTFNVAPVPLPAALPLFGTGLGIMGFIGWRRKRRMAAEAAA